MDDIINKLNQRIQLAQEENTYLNKQLIILGTQYIQMNNQNNTFEFQKQKQVLFKKIYDLKRKILHNKMIIYRSYERIDYIKRKGTDVPEEYKIIEFTNDNYHEINVSNIESQTKVQRTNRFLSGLFKKDLFSVQKTNEKQTRELNEKSKIFNDYVLAVKDLFNTIVDNINNYLVESSNKYQNINSRQLMFGLTKYLEIIDINPGKYNLPDKYSKDLKILKNSYIKMLTTELDVYLKSDLNSEDIINLSGFQFFGSKAIFTNHLNIFLNQLAEYQIEGFELETDRIRYDIKTDTIPFTTVSYFESFDIQDVQYESNLENSNTKRL